MSLCALAQAALLLGTLSTHEVERVCANADTLTVIAAAYRVPATRLVCLVHKETKWHNKRGSSGECGISQILPSKQRTCVKLSVDAYALEEAAKLIGPAGPWAAAAQRYCKGHRRHTMCVAQRTLAGYNAGTAAAHGRGRRLRRGNAYAATILSCEATMNAPAFHERIDVADLRVGDVVQYRSDRGGYRPGNVLRLFKQGGVPHAEIRAYGRKQKETVPLASVNEAFRDTMKDKEEL